MVPQSGFALLLFKTAFSLDFSKGFAQKRKIGLALDRSAMSVLLNQPNPNQPLQMKAKRRGWHIQPLANLANGHADASIAQKQAENGKASRIAKFGHDLDLSIE